MLKKNTEFIRLGDFRRLDIGFVLGNRSVEGKSCELEMTTQRSNCVNTTFKICDVEESPCVSTREQTRIKLENNAHTSLILLSKKDREKENTKYMNGSV